MSDQDQRTPPHTVPVGFSILQPNTRIPPHTGVNNSRLAPTCRWSSRRAAASGLAPRPAPRSRARRSCSTTPSSMRRGTTATTGAGVLIVDPWNPRLSEAEREMVRALTAGVGEYYGELPAYIQPPQRPN